MEPKDQIIEINYAKELKIKKRKRDKTMPRGIYKRKPFTKKHRENLSKARKGKYIGEKSPIFGKHHSKKTKKKMNKIRLKRKKELGYLNSTKTREKISKSLKGHASGKKGKKLSKETIRKIFQKAGNKDPSSLERKFQKIIDGYNLPYRYVGDNSFKMDRYNPDFINTNNQKIAIEVYTKFYKQRDGKNIEKWKEKRMKKFTEYGWNVIFFDETQVEEDYVLSQLKGGKLNETRRSSG